MFWSGNSSHLPGRDVWLAVNAYLQSQYKEWQYVLMVLKMIPESNANVERAFSFMKRVKTDGGTKTLSNAIDGPGEDRFDPFPAENLILTDKPRSSGDDSL